MVTGVVQLELHLPECSSLKEKRKILKSIIARIREKYNVSIREIDHQNLWQRATLGIAYVANSTFQAKKTLAGIERFVEELNKTYIIDSHLFLYKEE